MAKALVPAMHANGFGRVINVASTTVALPLPGFTTSLPRWR